jgi:hypothetical protein
LQTPASRLHSWRSSANLRAHGQAGGTRNGGVAVAAAAAAAAAPTEQAGPTVACQTARTPRLTTSRRYPCYTALPVLVYLLLHWARAGGTELEMDWRAWVCAVPVLSSDATAAATAASAAAV